MPASVATQMNAVAGIRVSTTKQAIVGDSPEDQQLQIEQYAAARGMTITKYFIFSESASKDVQPMQQAVNYCKDPKSNIQHFIIKSIDRFTRGGSDFYSPLKRQLDDCNVALVDIYGVISSQKINTLDHLGVKYKWSEFSPSQKSELLEAERAKDEIRDIQTRMIGAQIRYARMGYWVRRSLYGFDNVHIETREGKRCILEPNKKEAPLVIKMFELRARNTMEDQEIIDELNKLGFRTREYVLRDKIDRTKVLDITGGSLLTLKQLWRMIENPVYAGVNPEKWTQDRPVKCQFDGLVSMELFNRANRGKLIITEDDSGVHIHRRKPPEYLVKKGVKNTEFPYKRIIMCPECRKPLYGSASRGRHGKYFPAYHCDHRGHNFRRNKKVFDKAIEDFVKCLSVSPNYIDALEVGVNEAFEKRQIDTHRDALTIDKRINELQKQVRVAVDKIKLVSSASAIKYLEEDIVKLEAEIEELNLQRCDTEPQKPTNMEKINAQVRYYLEHLEELLLHHCNPILQAKYFGVIFNEAPTFADIESGTPDISKITGVNEVFVAKEHYSETLGWG